MPRVTHRNRSNRNHEALGTMRVVKSSYGSNGKYNNRNKMIIGNTNFCVLGTILNVLSILTSNL